ncbi:glycosyltransferase [Acidithiobacillus ferriphilus]|uniref:glycosyltransferase n=1 Tax=Acidithiobacillus ferriphilus TaxID=1689834 RepID=UPI001C071939|nr:glycosyltransferase [Acidithiobacillus ferriphilus]MBU2844320.1 glycosyltransferase [Acidithiobacillus ferriphilus]
MASLVELYLTHSGKISDRWLSYLKKYDELLSDRRDKPIRLLEIGIQNGGSLEIWAKYFRYAEKIVGVDIDPLCANLKYIDDKIFVETKDAYSDDGQRDIKNISPYYDLIIEDGSHCSGHIIDAFARYFPLLSEDGIFVAEDLHCSYWETYDGGLVYPNSSISFFKRLVDIINHEHWGISVDRSKYLSGFHDTYGCHFDERMLNNVHSIEFVNSMCIIHKGPRDQNTLGKRIIVGDIEGVSTGALNYNGSFSNAIDQTENIWSSPSIIGLIGSNQIVKIENDLRTAEARLKKSELIGEKVATLTRTIDEKNLQISALLRELEAANKQTDALTHGIDEKNSQINTLTCALTEIQTEFKSISSAFSETISSRSWKMTRPAREFKAWNSRQLQRINLLTRLYRHDESGHQARFHIARAFWRKLPFSSGTKLRLRSVLFRTFPKMLNNLSRVPIGSYFLVSEGKGLQYISASEPPPIHVAPVSIIVCVHNALYDVKQCLESVLQYTTPPYELILIDDGSDALTRDFLREVTPSYGATLLRNESAQGYTKAANKGLETATGRYLLLLNSDTIVSPDWLDRMVACMESSPRVGIVGPLSNTASWQSVPKVREHDDWAENKLPQDIDIVEMANEIARTSARVYPLLPFLNGFCLLINGSLYREIGAFDEEYFGAGYGEENDYCLRARAAGWQLCVADDTYVFHSQSRSYSHERRAELAARADTQLRKKYDFEREILPAVVQCQDDRLLHGIRVRVGSAIARKKIRDLARPVYEGARIAVVLPVADEGGGGHVIIQECQALAAMGVNIRILNLECNREQFQRSYPTHDLETIFCTNPETLSIEAFRRDFPYDLIIATANFCVAWLSSATGPQLMYYVQDFEPDFYPLGSSAWSDARKSYTLLPSMKLVTKTQWNARILREKVGVEAKIIGPSVDIDFFRPRPRTKGAPRLCAMIRPATPRRAPDRTLRVLAALKNKFGDDIELYSFGCTQEEFMALAAKYNISTQGIKHRGRLIKPDVADLLNYCDIFADFSDYQAMGLTALESMACGNVVLAPQNSGACDFIHHGKNGWLVDSADEKACIDATSTLLNDAALRYQIADQALEDSVNYFPELAAINLLDEGLGRNWRHLQERS